LAFGNFVQPCGNLVLSSGNLTLSFGILVLPFGNLTLSFGILVLPFGNLTLSSGNFILPFGNLALPPDKMSLRSGRLSSSSCPAAGIVGESTSGNFSREFPTCGGDRDGVREVFESAGPGTGWKYRQRPF
jgi:hypothetical protein